MDPREHFPAKSELQIASDDVGRWAGITYGTAFRSQKLTQPDGSDYMIRVGRLSWNPEQAKLVVIDGQHRAMALLAIDRTLNNTWAASGEKYRHFYEPKINEILKELTAQQKSIDFSNVEFPVNICWFPELDHPYDSQQKAARKLFVDLNGNAKPPSLSRLMLLSDTELVNIFSRRLLSDLRDSDSPVPIYSVEYDHPERFASAPGKWSTMSSLSMIAACVKRSVFGPSKFINEVNANFGGREPEREMDLYMQDRLQISKFIEEVVEEDDRTIKRVDVGNTTFPQTKLKQLEDTYRNTWGVLVMEMLQSLLPYQVHASSLTQLRNDWATGDSYALLAKDAIFAGVGMYWTLRDSADSFRIRNEQRRAANPQNPKLLPKTDVIKAWEAIESKRADFNKLRSKAFLGKDTEDATKLSDECFKVFNTHACQLGFVLTASTLVFRSKIAPEQLPEVFKIIVQAANAGMTAGPPARKYGRKTLFARSEKYQFNAIKKMDTPLAPYFRYFWLELLATPEAQALLADHITPELVFTLRDEARSFYLTYMIEDLTKALKGKPVVEGKDDPKTSATSQLQVALNKWFGIQNADFETWKENLTPVAKSSTSASASSDDADDDESTEADAADDVDELESVQDILSTVEE